MFRNLPHEYVDVAHLKKVAQHGSESESYMPSFYSKRRQRAVGPDTCLEN